MPAGQLAALRATCPHDVFLLGRRSAWVDGALCAWMVRRLAQAFSHYMRTSQPILFFDALRAHVANCVCAACAEVQIWPVFVQARMTWLLQLAHTHALLRYKICLQQLCHASRVRAVDGDLTLSKLLSAVFGAIRRVLEECEWSDAFDRDGYGVAQSGVSERVLRELGAEAPPALAAIRPTGAQLQVCFPRNRRPSADLVWRALSRAGVGACEAAAPAAGGALALATAGPRRSSRIAGRALSGAAAALPTAPSSSTSASSSAPDPLVVTSVSGSSSAGAARARGDNHRCMTRSRTKSLRTG